jgi:predicted ATPase/transcriptional regulator with XRE-family HTH domain
LRLRAGLTRQVLAERAEVGVATLAALEGGQRRRPHPHTVVALANALGLDESGRSALLELASSPVTEPKGLAPAEPIAPTHVSGRALPEPPTALIGREAEVSAATALLDPARSEVRLLTLTGPGGVGKTRLGLAVADALAPAYSDGVVFIDLAPLRDGRLVPATIARALGLRESSGRSAHEQLLEHLRQQQVLLLLDNFEHLLDAAPVLAELLGGCPRLALLVTSRAALRLRSERRFAVPVLATPSGTVPSLEAIAASPAVSLFVQRAQAVASGFVLNQRTAQAVGAICRQLEGLPLAIELAAARVPLLPVESLLRRLERRLPVLTGGAPDLPERQQTLRRTLAWSHELLDANQRLLFQRLAVFVGGWTVEAAESVCAGAGLSVDDVFANLGVLLDASLVRRLDSGREEPRFAMLQIAREFALEQLKAAGEADTLARRHFNWCLALAESVVPLEPTAEQFERLAQEQDNLRVALRWSIDAGELLEGQMALRLGVALYPLWYTRGQYTEGRAWLAELLAVPVAATPTALRAQALAWAGHLACLQGMLADAEALLEVGLTLAQQTQDTLVQSICWQILGSAHRRRGALLRAEAAYQQSLAFARTAQSAIQVAWAAYLVAYTRYELGDVAAVRLALGEAVQVHAADASPRVRARLLRLQAWLAAQDGDHAAALAFEEQGLALLQRLSDQQGLAFGNLEAARRALDRGDRPRAAQHLSATLTIARDTGDRLALADGLEGVAQLMASTRQDQSAYLLGTATVARQTSGLSRTPVHQTWLDSWLTEARDRLPEAAYQLAWENGQRAPLEHVTDLALGLAVDQSASPQAK